MIDKSTRERELIGRAIDAGERLPDWLQQKVAADPSLKSFYDVSMQLAGELRGGACQWVDRNRSSLTSSNHALVDLLAKKPNTPLPLTARMSRFAKSQIALMSVATAALVMLLGSIALWSNKQNLVSSVVVDALPYEPSRRGEATNTDEFPSGPEQDAFLESGSVAELPTEMSPGERFERYFYVTLESSFRALHSVGETLTEKAVGEPLSRTIQQCSQTDIPGDIGAQSLPNQRRLNAQQIQLMHDLLRTADFLVDTFPREATRPWMELSIASKDSSH